MICEVWSTSIHHNDCHSNLTSLVMVSTHQVVLLNLLSFWSCSFLCNMCTVLCVATSSSEFWSTQRILKPDILPSVDILLSRIIACVGTEGEGGWVWCQRLKVSSLSYPAHQSHQSAAHINIDLQCKRTQMFHVICNLAHGLVSCQFILS